VLKVLLTVSPFGPSFPLQLRVFSRSFDSCDQPRSLSHAVSCYCALFDLSCRSFFNSDPLFSTACALFSKYTRGGVPLRQLGAHCVSALSLAIDFLPLCFHGVTNPSSRKCFVFTSIQNPGGGGGPRLWLTLSIYSTAQRRSAALGLAIVNSSEADCVLSIGAE
jgi:hypothetical protein